MAKERQKRIRAREKVESETAAAAVVAAAAAAVAAAQSIAFAIALQDSCTVVATRILAVQNRRSVVGVWMDGCGSGDERRKHPALTTLLPLLLLRVHSFAASLLP